MCGDWYDLVELTGDRIAVAVGDVVGHGLVAACVKGQLRSALSAATLVADSPAQALEALGLYARSIEGAESTTVATIFIDWLDHTVTYSSAGHPPPVLLAPDGTTAFLDKGPAASGHHDLVAASLTCAGGRRDDVRRRGTCPGRRPRRAFVPRGP